MGRRSPGRSDGRGLRRPALAGAGAGKLADQEPGVQARGAVPGAPVGWSRQGRPAWSELCKPGAVRSAAQSCAAQARVLERQRPAVLADASSAEACGLAELESCDRCRWRYYGAAARRRQRGGAEPPAGPWSRRRAGLATGGDNGRRSARERAQTVLPAERAGVGETWLAAAPEQRLRQVSRRPAGRRDVAPAAPQPLPSSA